MAESPSAFRLRNGPLIFARIFAWIPAHGRPGWGKEATDAPSQLLRTEEEHPSGGQDSWISCQFHSSWWIHHSSDAPFPVASDPTIRSAQWLSLVGMKINKNRWEMPDLKEIKHKVGNEMKHMLILWLDGLRTGGANRGKGKGHDVWEGEGEEGWQREHVKRVESKG